MITNSAPSAADGNPTEDSTIHESSVSATVGAVQMPDRVWIHQDQDGLVVFLSDPFPPIRAVEYQRTLSRSEVDKLAFGEGVDTQQLINSQQRTIAGQRKHIASLQRQLASKE